MKIFEFGNKIIEKVKNELENAEKFIHIAVFQLHRMDIFKTLSEKIKQGVAIEIFTLPYDSINVENADEIKVRFQDLEKRGAILHHCRWNVGDPSRTTTAVGKWYSYHGKFIVTEKVAIAMSANLTEQAELDAILIYREEKQKIEEFERKFQWLKELFIIKHEKYDGMIRQKIINAGLSDVEELFKLPRNINSDIYKDHWIQDYPEAICSEPNQIEHKFYIAPFDCKALPFFKTIISKAEKFVYISTETFTDPEFPDFLKKISLKNIEIKILSGTKTMDFSDRIQKMFRELLAQKILIRTTEEELHAKLLITDKTLVLSSINLNKISLGFSRRKGYWRANTETINVCNEKQLIELAKKNFDKIFDNSISVEYKIEEKLGADLAKTIRTIFEIKSISGDVKSILSHFVLKKEIETKSLFFNLSEKISEIIKHFNKNKIGIEDFKMGVIVYLLNRQKLTLEQIEKRVEKFDIDFDLSSLLDVLLKEGFIEKTGDYYHKLKYNKKSGLSHYL